jgi:hypothetical protein
LTVFQIVAFVAGSTISIIGVSPALIRDGDTDFLRVEDPSIGAFQANLIVPVPSSTAQIGRLSVVGLRKDTFSFFKIVSVVARCAVSIFSMSFALVRNWGTHLVSVEDPSV